MINLDETTTEAPREVPLPRNAVLDKTTISSSYNNAPVPEVVENPFVPSYTEFEYKPGQSIADILNRKQETHAKLEKERTDASRMGKVAAFTQLLSSLGGLAGGGHGVVTEKKESPYLKMAFSKMDSMRNQQMQMAMYYEDLERKTKASEEAMQYKAHLQNQKERNQYGYKEGEALQRQAANIQMEQYKSNKTSISNTYKDPTMDNARMQVAKDREKRLAGKETTKKPFYVYMKPDGSRTEMTKSGAINFVDAMIKEYNTLLELSDNEMLTRSDEDRALREDLMLVRAALASDNVQKSDNEIMSFVARHMPGREVKYGYLFEKGGGQPSNASSGSNTSIGTNPAGSLLP